MLPPDVALIAPYPTGGQLHAGPSGVASYTANLAHALADVGMRVDVVAASEPDEGAVEAAWDGSVRVHRAYQRGGAALPVAVAAALDTGAPVVHLQHEVFLYGGPLSAAGLVPGLARLRRGARTVVTLHQVVDTTTVDKSFTDLHRVKVPASMARAALGGVQKVAASLSDVCVVHEEEFSSMVEGSVVIPHGVEVQPHGSQAAARRRLGLDDRPVVLCFGFLAPYKGLEAVLDAAEVLGPDAVQVVVAGGPHPRLAAAGDDYADALQARYEHLGARFTGWVPEGDVVDWFRAADVAVFAYPAPFSSSGALALALAHGTPVLLSEAMGECTGAPADLVTSVEARDLAARLARLCDPAERHRLGAASASFAQGRSWPRVAEEHASLYERLVA